MSTSFSFTKERFVRLSGVYAIIHRDTGMTYVGSSSDMAKRVESHLRSAKDERNNTPLYRAIRALGADAFDFEVLERCPKESLQSREDFNISLFDSASANGLNVLSKSYRRNYFYKPNAGTLERMRVSQLGKKRTPETCAKIGAIHRGKKVSPETGAKIAANNRLRRHTPEAKAKVSAANIGKVISMETKIKMSLAMTGKKRSAQGCANIKASKAHVSAETREKMSAAQNRRRALEKAFV